jgi:mannobiose 2-epimerase
MDKGMNTESLQHELEQRILPYWSTKTLDETHGGFIGRIDGENRVIPNAHKSAILNARILWTYSAAYRVLNRPDLKDLAERAQTYLIDRFWDKEHGGLVWMLDHRGDVFSSKKHAYAQAFGIYGFSEHARATGDEDSLAKAIELFQLLETHSFSEQTQGYYEAFDREWKPLDDVRLGSSDAFEKRSTNTHLHILEAYTNLYRVWPDELLRVRLTHLLDLFLGPIYDAENHHFIAFFAEDWSPKSSIYSYGHDIETTWLIQDAAEVLADPERIVRTREVVMNVAAFVLREGVDTKYGGLFNFGKDGHVYDSDKHWWAQAEAMIGFLNMYQISGDESYLTAANNIWSFTQEHILDHEFGEWFFRVTRNGQPYAHEDKIGPWKCPYHTVRACLEVIQRSQLVGEPLTK